MINISQIDFFPPLILLETGHIMNINRAEIATRILTRQNPGVSLSTSAPSTPASLKISPIKYVGLLLSYFEDKNGAS